MIDVLLVEQAMLKHCTFRWQKTAKTMTTVWDELMPADADEFDVQILLDNALANLVSAGRLESQGNISIWRYSDVRLPQE